MGAVLLTVLCLDVAYQVVWGVLGFGVLGAVLGCREFARLARAHAPGVQRLPMTAISVLLVLSAFAPLLSSCPCVATKPWAGLILALGFGWAAVRQMSRLGPDGTVANLGATMLGIVYIGLTLHVLSLLALLPERGGLFLMLAVATVKFGDVAAFFGGRALGGRLFGVGRKMAPAISPGKTWEGFACSFIGAVGAAYGFTALFDAVFHRELFAGHLFAGNWQPLIWGLALGPAGAAGDLIESCLKRDAAVKDSGTILPGFGGFLDLFDALVLAAPVAYLLASVL